MQDVLTCLRPTVVALIASAGVTILLLVTFGGANAAVTTLQWTGVTLFAAALFALRKWKPSPIFIMACCGMIGLALHVLGIGP